MPKEIKLSKSMTETEFDNGYWYAYEIKAFAKEIGISLAAKFRKDELEKIIKIYLRTGKNFTRFKSDWFSLQPISRLKKYF